MMSVARLLSYIKIRFRRGRTENDLSEELRFHLQNDIKKNIASGMTLEDARYAALRSFGGVDQVKEQCRDLHPLRFVDELLQDTRYALRMLRKSPGFTMVAVLTLGLGIGINTSIFSVVYAMLLRPLRLPDPDRLVFISEVESKQRRTRPPTMSSYREWPKHSRTVDAMALGTFGGDAATLSGIGHAERILVDYASPNLFSVLGVNAFRGRTFLAEDSQSEDPDAIVISYDFWQRTFDSRPEAVGQTVSVDGSKKTIVGVMPPGFSVFPGRMEVDVWLVFVCEARDAQTRWLDVIGRLKPGIGLEQAQADLNVIARRLDTQASSEGGAWAIKIETLHSAAVRESRGFFYLLIGSVGFVLLIACTNVANLFLARAAARQKEIAIRASLGAGRRRLLRQLLTESVVLAVFGGILGILLSVWGKEIVVALAPDPFMSSLEPSIDLRALAFTVVISLSTGLLFGIAPALQATNDLSESMKGTGARSGGRAQDRGRTVLLVSEVALSLVLLVGAGLLMNSFLRLQRVDLGFNPRNVLTADIFLNGPKYWQQLPNIMKRVTPQGAIFFQQVLERVQMLPGVVSACITHLAPPGDVQIRSLRIIDRAALPEAEEPHAGYNEVSPGFFRTLEVPLRQGRYLTERDIETTPWVVVINETMARRIFPNEDPIGKQVQLRILGGATGLNVVEDRPREIVGVVGDVRHWGLSVDAHPVMYGSYRQHVWEYPGGYYIGHLWKDLIVRTASDPMKLAPAVQKVVAEVDPDQAVYDIQTMEAGLSDSLAGRRFMLRLFGIFGGLAVLLAAVGIYGIVSYLVTERTHEFGVRIALGAQRKDVLNLVISRVLKTTVVGVFIGVAGSLALTRLISGSLYGVTAIDPLTYSLVSLSLIGVAVAASYIPARRATRVDPVVALRYE